MARLYDIAFHLAIITYCFLFNYEISSFHIMKKFYITGNVIIKKKNSSFLLIFEVYFWERFWSG